MFFNGYDGLSSHHISVYGNICIWTGILGYFISSHNFLKLKIAPTGCGCGKKSCA